MVTTFENRCVSKSYLIVLRPILVTTYKGVKQVKIYMWALHHKLFLFQQSRIFFGYVPENDIKEDILGWNPSLCLWMKACHPWNCTHLYLTDTQLPPKLRCLCRRVYNIYHQSADSHHYLYSRPVKISLFWGTLLTDMKNIILVKPGKYMWDGTLLINYLQ